MTYPRPEHVPLRQALINKDYDYVYTLIHDFTQRLGYEGMDAEITEFLTQFFVENGIAISETHGQEHLDILISALNGSKLAEIGNSAVIAMLIAFLVKEGHTPGVDFSYDEGKLRVPEYVYMAFQRISPFVNFPIHRPITQQDLAFKLEQRLGVPFVRRIVDLMIEREKELNRFQLNEYLLRIYTGVYNATGIKIWELDQRCDQYLPVDATTDREITGHWVTDLIEAAGGLEPETKAQGITEIQEDIDQNTEFIGFAMYLKKPDLERLAEVYYSHDLNPRALLQMQKDSGYSEGDNQL